MKRVLIQAFLVCSLFGGYSQVSGYMGNRIFVNVHTSLTPDYKLLVIENTCDKAFRMRMPLSADINYVVSDEISLGAGGSVTSSTGTFSHIVLDYYDFSDDYYSGVVHYKTNFIFAYLEGHRSMSYSIIDNYFRLGLVRASLTNSSYDYELVEQYNNSVVLHDFPDSIASFRLDQRARMIGLYYEFGNRIPVSNHLLLYYGVSGYYFPFRKLAYEHYSGTSARSYSNDTFIRDLGKKRVSNNNFFNFNIGLTWAF